MRTPAELRPPDGRLGKIPAECQTCRDEHAGEAWCLAHNAWEALSAFKPNLTSWRGVDTACRRGRREQEFEQAGGPALMCESCLVEKPSREFSGRGKGKRGACLECESLHPGQQWCKGHQEWLPVDAFMRSGAPNRAYCSACFRLSMHGVTMRQVLDRQGVKEPVCAACGSADRLTVHHDHSCCDKGFGCERCVQGFLCSSCNVAEGMLKTPERALALYRFMASSSVIPLTQP